MLHQFVKINICNFVMVGPVFIKILTKGKLEILVCFITILGSFCLILDGKVLIFRPKLRIGKSQIFFWPRCEETCLRRFANNKGADQPVHPHRLISAFVILLKERIISRLATSEISIF